ncbi:MAG: hypothetical protein CMC70_01370 [Flavobacteriaceae bacterium]|nr:hypothetical protein [Flavobacteriaceae bacterium]|tara:strand:- start:208 stop:777 length:570 start_codon:yes stop_codon:yes gene_type:complete
MRKVIVSVQGISNYSQSKLHETPKLNKETADDFENRTWREKCTVNSKGYLHIPPMAFKLSLASAAKKLGLQIPGRGKSTYTKYFEADLICEDDDGLTLPIKKEDVTSVRLPQNSDGVRGSGKRVWRTFPIIPSGWKVQATFSIMDDTITREVFQEVFHAAGFGIGIGRWRPQNGGLNGRFESLKYHWDK